MTDHIPAPRPFDLSAFSLMGQTAIVTGGQGGLGQALTLALASAGAKVLVTGRTEDAEKTRAIVEATDAEYRFVAADLTADGACRAVVEACLDAWGRADILVNCAGISINRRDVTQFGRAEWDRMVDLNLTAAFEMIHEICPQMIAQGHGKIINIASMYSYFGGRWSPAYSATKHGIVGLTKAMADELGGHNIQVNAIAPGFFATPLTEDTRSDPDRNAEILSRIPANRWGTDQDLMGAVVFLASAASNYVNGTTLPVDGGYLIR